MTYISIVHDAKNGKKHITVDKDGEVRHYVVNDNIMDALITHTLFPGSQLWNPDGGETFSEEDIAALRAQGKELKIRNWNRMKPDKLKTAIEEKLNGNHR